MEEHRVSIDLNFSQNSTIEYIFTYLLLNVHLKSLGEKRKKEKKSIIIDIMIYKFI